MLKYMNGMTVMEQWLIRHLLAVQISSRLSLRCYACIRAAMPAGFLSR